jgi:hypothetical protein
LQDPPNIIQIWIFGLKINHLATQLHIPADELTKSLPLDDAVRRVHVRHGLKHLGDVRPQDLGSML